jgi:hypothetical protein
VVFEPVPQLDPMLLGISGSSGASTVCTGDPAHTYCPAYD